MAQKCCKSKKSVFWHPQRHASSRNIKTFVLPHKTGHLRVDSSHIWTQLRGGLSLIVEMVMGETKSHVSRPGRLRKAPEEAKSHKAKPEGKSEECQFLSGRILAKSLVPEPKTSLKCSITSLVSGTKLRFSKKKFTFSDQLEGALEAHHSPPCRGMWGELPQACAPGTKGRRARCDIDRPGRGER